MKKLSYVEAKCGFCGKPFSAMVDPEECFRDYCSNECDYADMVKQTKLLWAYYECKESEYF